jgi:hypothetical protein
MLNTTPSVLNTTLSVLAPTMLNTTPSAPAVQLRKVHAGVGAYREFDAFATFFDKLDAHFIDAARARLWLGHHLAVRLRRADQRDPIADDVRSAHSVRPHR